LLARDWKKHAENRRVMLVQKSSTKMNWCGVVVANHLCKDLTKAESALDNLMEFCNETKKKDELKPSELNEIYMYKSFL